jgi:hypothetical protein
LTRRAANAPGEKETTVLDDATLEDIEDKAWAAMGETRMSHGKIVSATAQDSYRVVVEKLERAQADAAAMREAVGPAFDQYLGQGEEPTALEAAFPVFRDNQAGRALLAAHAAQLAAKDEEIAGLKAENVCDACVGSGSPVSGLPCMCGGTGKMSRAAVNLREQLITERQGWRRDCDRIVGKLRAKDKEIATERQSHAHTIEVAKNEAAWRKQLQTELAAERQLADDLNEGLRLWSDELHASESITGRFIAAELKRRFALAPTATPAADGDTGKETP